MKPESLIELNNAIYSAFEMLLLPWVDYKMKILAILVYYTLWENYQHGSEHEQLRRRIATWLSSVNWGTIDGLQIMWLLFTHRICNLEISVDVRQLYEEAHTYVLGYAQQDNPKLMHFISKLPVSNSEFLTIPSSVLLDILQAHIDGKGIVKLCFRLHNHSSNMLTNSYTDGNSYPIPLSQQDYVMDIIRPFEISHYLPINSELTSEDLKAHIRRYELALQMYKSHQLPKDSDRNLESHGLGVYRQYTRNEFRTSHGSRLANTSRPPSIHIDEFMTNMEQTNVFPVYNPDFEQKFQFRQFRQMHGF
jgi:hypothetical protein